MLSKSESHTPWQESVISSTWLTNILEEWTGVEYHCLYYISFILLVLNIIIFAPLLIFMSSCWFLNLLLHIYKRKNGLDEDFSNKSWDNVKFMLTSILSMHGKLWHGIALLFSLFPAVHSGRDKSVEILKKGNLLGVSPGGAREAFFSDENYNLLWGNRKGFAQVAIDAKVPIIPLFTQNIREGYRTFGKIGFFRWFYEKSRLLLIPMYGGFPVKLRTYVGDPIPYDPNITATELVEKTKIALETLRDRHQKLPGSILRALLERFDKHQKED